MTKQEEIREGLAQLPIMDSDNCNYLRCREYKDDCSHCRTDYILSYLHSQGVVIKVNREEMASICGYCECLDSCSEEHSECDNFRLFTGYVAVEPLIKED